MSVSPDLETVLANFGVDYKIRHRDVRVGWIGIVCPFCGKGTEYYMGLNTESLAANCWRCGTHKIGDVLRPLGVTKQALAGLFRDRSATQSPYDGKEVSHGAYNPPACVPLSDAPRAFARYLKSRNLDPDAIAELWGVQAIVPPSKYRWRLFIPVTYQDQSGSWTTRSINPECPHNLRYLSAPPEREAVHLTTILYGADYCHNHAAIVVEGPTDLWAIGPGAISTLGMGITSRQLSRIARFPVRVVAFDNEPKAQKRADTLCRKLAEYPGQTIRYVFTGNDAASSPRKEINRLRRTYF
jgi:hypothetical protein